MQPKGVAQHCNGGNLKKKFKKFHTRLPPLAVSLGCFDTVGWVTGRASGCKKKLRVSLLLVTFR